MVDRIEQMSGNVEQTPKQSIDNQSTPVEKQLSTALLQTKMTKDAFSRMEQQAPEEIVAKVKEQLSALEHPDQVLLEGENIVRTLEEVVAYFSAAEMPQEPTREQLEQIGNYSGDWTELVKARVGHPIGYCKFILRKLSYYESLRPGTPGMLDKPKDFRNYCLDQMQAYDEILSRVFSKSNVLESHESGKPSSALGVGKIGESPTVFSDATHRGEPLSARQKNIVESHEAGHGVREFVGSEAVDIRSLMNAERIPTEKRTYFSDPNEIAERMSQLKSYFGMDATARFTKSHLVYARERYVKDTGLDNDITLFFDAISDDERFVQLMNELPL